MTQGTAIVKTNRIQVICMECGKKFATVQRLPLCPRCGGADVEVR